LFRIGILELGVTCFIAILAIAVPAVIIWVYRQVDARLKNLENKLDQKIK
jgi:hypothetical protein